MKVTQKLVIEVIDHKNKGLTIRQWKGDKSAYERISYELKYVDIKNKRKQAMVTAALCNNKRIEFFI